MTRRWIIFLTLSMTLPAGSQTRFTLSAPHDHDSTLVVAWEWMAGEPQQKNTPAYRLYRQGYALILREDWENARKIFSEISTGYSSSEYADDAAYWTAYALMHTDSAKALTAYREFLHKYPQSRYFDDAVADFALLEARNNLKTVLTPGGQAFVFQAPARPPLTYGRVFSMTHAGGSFAVQEWNVTLFQHSQPGKLAPVVEEVLRRERVDPDTRMRIEGLARIPDPTRNEQAFEVVKDVSIDFRQPEPVRYIALRSLADFRGFDPVHVYLEVVRKDTSPELLTVAVRSLERKLKDSNGVADTLIHFYENTPNLPPGSRSALVGAVAAADNERAKHFLTWVARSEGNPAVRISAIEGLGRIPWQREKSLEVLEELYEKQPRPAEEVLSSTLFAAAEIGSDRAVDFLARVARTENDPRLRGEAVYYLSNIGGEKARTALREILLERRAP